ncbi:hypothetical protein, partial [Mesorhizobium sp.]|uniref:hypothetical protein n=1 Tax=Mesorhizobium sp. TaxID=1871066 RepID=UPI00257D7EB8
GNEPHWTGRAIPVRGKYGAAQHGDTVGTEAAIVERYRGVDKRRILNEFGAVIGYYRKRARSVL